MMSAKPCEKGNERGDMAAEGGGYGARSAGGYIAVSVIGSLNLSRAAGLAFPAHATPGRLHGGLFSLLSYCMRTYISLLRHPHLIKYTCGGAGQ